MPAQVSMQARLCIGLSRLGVSMQPCSCCDASRVLHAVQACKSLCCTSHKAALLQEVPQYRRVSGPTAPPISDWKGFHAAQSGYPVALNAEPAFFSPLQHGQMQRPRTTRDVP